MSDEQEAEYQRLETQLPQLSNPHKIKNLKLIDMKEIATKFVNWGVRPLEDLQDTKAYILRTRLNDNGRLNREEKNWITKMVNDNAYFKFAIPVFGWMFDFSDVLNTYLVSQYGRWQEYKAVDKTALRNILFGKIDKIVKL